MPLLCGPGTMRTFMPVNFALSWSTPRQRTMRGSSTPETETRASTTKCEIGGWWLVCSLMMTMRAVPADPGAMPRTLEPDEEGAADDVVDLVDATDLTDAEEDATALGLLGELALREATDEAVGRFLRDAAAVAFTVEVRPAETKASGCGFSSRWTAGSG